MRRPSTPTAIASAALAVALVGFAPQAEATVSHVLLADNARKLQGRSLRQVRANVDAARLQGRTLAQVRRGVDASLLAGRSLAQVRGGIDAASLGGVAAAAFVQGRSAVAAARTTVADGSAERTVLTLPGGLGLTVTCGTGALRLFARDDAGAPADLTWFGTDGTTATSGAFQGEPGGAAIAQNVAIAIGTAELSTARVVATLRYSASAAAGHGCTVAVQETLSRL